MALLGVTAYPTAGAAWLAERDPRLRIVGAVAFALTIVALQALSTLLVALVLASAGALLLGVPTGALVWRLLALEGLMLVLVVSLPITVPGPAAAHVAGVALSWPGLHQGAEILLTASAVMVGTLALLATLDAARLGYALARLHVPARLVHLFLFTVRYVGVLQGEYQRLRRAMRARAFVAGNNRHSWRSFGWLFGMLLVRGLERSRRVHDAMRCRGFEGRFRLAHDQHWERGDTLAAMVWLILLGALLGWEQL